MKRCCKLLVTVLFIVSMLASLAGVASAAEMKTAIGIVNARSGLRLREEASTSSRILDTAHHGDAVVIISKCGDWYRVNYNLTEGYMYGEYLTVKERENVELGYGAIDASLVNLRQGPSTSTTALMQLASGKKVSIFGFNCGWYKVNYDGTVGYIRSDLVELLEKPYDNFGASLSSLTKEETSQSFSSASNTSSSGSSIGQQIATYAQSFVGYPYVYGGSSPSGFDCSGFMQYLFAHFGYSINRTATDQLANGYKVSRENMKPGDIIYFGYGNEASHVGMYIGNDQFVHAENPSTGVVITNLSTTYYSSRFLCAHRIVD